MAGRGCDGHRGRWRAACVGVHTAPECAGKKARRAGVQRGPSPCAPLEGCANRDGGAHARTASGDVAHSKASERVRAEGANPGRMNPRTADRATRGGCAGSRPLCCRCGGRFCCGWTCSVSIHRSLRFCPRAHRSALPPLVNAEHEQSGGQRRADQRRRTNERSRDTHTQSTHQHTHCRAMSVRVCLFLLLSPFLPFPSHV